MVLILVEPSYSRSIWCLNLLDGLTVERGALPEALDQVAP